MSSASNVSRAYAKNNNTPRLELGRERIERRNKKKKDFCIIIRWDCNHIVVSWFIYRRSWIYNIFLNLCCQSDYQILKQVTSIFLFGESFHNLIVDTQKFKSLIKYDYCFVKNMSILVLNDSRFVVKVTIWQHVMFIYIFILTFSTTFTWNLIINWSCTITEQMGNLNTKKYQINNNQYASQVCFFFFFF